MTTNSGSPRWSLTQYPNKRPTQRIGITPDIEVRPTIAGIAAGRDEVLEGWCWAGRKLDFQGDRIREGFFAAYNKVTSKKDLVIYPDFAHEPLPGEPERTFNFMLGL